MRELWLDSSTLLLLGGYCLPAIRIKCDLTYGIFLYHWVVLNVIVHYDLINLWDWGWCLLLLVTVTFALAWLSWRFVGRASGKLIKRILNKNELRGNMNAKEN